MVYNFVNLGRVTHLRASCRRSQSIKSAREILDTCPTLTHSPFRILAQTHLPGL
jgi:hypothetical protein